MTEPTSPGNGGAPSDPWPGVFEGIVQGFTHDLNNRLLVLLGVRDLLEPPAGADAGLLELMDGELTGLEADVRLLRRLVAAEDDVEAVETAELLTAARALHRRHRELQAVHVEWRLPEGLPAVLARPGAALRALLLLMAASAEIALEAGAREAAVEARVEAGAVVVVLTPAAVDGSPYLEAARARLEPDWGEVNASPGACGLSLKAAGD